MQLPHLFLMWFISIRAFKVTRVCHLTASEYNIYWLCSWMPRITSLNRHFCLIKVYYSVQQTNSSPIWLETDHTDSAESKPHQQHFLGKLQDKLLLHWLEWQWTPAAPFCLPQKNIFHHSSLLRSPLHKAKKSDSLFYRKPWMKLSLWGNYFREKVTSGKAVILLNSNSHLLLSHSWAAVLSLFSMFLIAALLCIGKKGALILRKLSWIRRNWDACDG